MAWNIHVRVDECESMSILLNNEDWKSWYRTDGDVTWPVPPRFADLAKIKVGATVHPEGKNGKLEVKWDGRLVQTFDFDNYEDHECNKPSPPPAPREPGRDGGDHGTHH